MNFLNPLFLLALPLVALPIVIHLLRRKQRQVVSWGAMQFLTDAVGEGKRFDRLEEWVLLALRALALLVLILALARPLISGLNPTQSASREVLLIIDDSLSTDRVVSGEKVFKTILVKVNKFLDECTPGDRVRVMLAAGGTRWLFLEPVQATPAGKREITESLQQLQSTRGAANFSNCLRLAVSLEAEEENVARTIVLFTDGQKQGWQTHVQGVWEQLGEAIKLGQRNVSLRVVTTETPEFQGVNLSLDYIQSSKQRVAQNELLVVKTQITNTGTIASEPTPIIWSLNGKQKEEIVLPSIAAGEKFSTEWQTRLDKLGVTDVSATVEESDGLSLDNRSHFMVEVVKSLPILVLVKSDDLAIPENKFFAEALGFYGEENSEQNSKSSNDSNHWHSLFQPTFVPFDNANDVKFANYHAVVISSLGEHSSDLFKKGMIKKLEAYVQEGGGLWLLLGSRLDRDDFNRRWYRDGSGLCPLPLVSLMRPAEQENADALVHPPSRSQSPHSATTALADTDRLDIDHIRLQRYHLFRQLPGRTPESLLKTGRGAPLALLHYSGKGRVIVQPFPFQTTWSDLPISKSFVVLVQEWLTYLTQPAATRYNLSPREPFQFELAAGIEASTAKMILPDRTSLVVEPLHRQGTSVYRFAQTSLPGKYELRTTLNNKSVKLPIHVTRDANESNLTNLQADDLAMLEKTCGIQFDGREPRVSAMLKPIHSQRKPTWWPLLIAMVCLMVAESLFAVRISKGRYGSVAPA